jgi:hypothetical protein
MPEFLNAQKRILLLLLLISGFSCKCFSQEYYLGRKKEGVLFFRTFYYVLAEKKSDSIHFTFLRDHYVHLLGKSNYDTTVLFAKCQGTDFAITKAGKRSIKCRYLANHRFINEKLKRLRVERKYHRLLNLINAKIIYANSPYHDSLSNALLNQVRNYNRMPWECRIYEWRNINLEMHSDSFPAVYTFEMEKCMREAVRNANKISLIKKAFYDSLSMGLLPCDPDNYQRMLDQYHSTYFDSRTFLLMTKTNPELFYLNYNNNPLSQNGQVFSCVAHGIGCFTRAELDEMYCRLKPFRDRDKDGRLWMYERHGDLKCQKE